MAEQSSLIEEFVNVTGVDEERAEFYLSSAGWKLQVALSSFYEHGDEDAEQPPASPAAAATASQPPSRSPAPTAYAAAAVDRSSLKKQPAASAVSSRRIATLASVQSHRGHQHSSDSEEGEEGQAYYAGGSEESGQQIIGPSKKKNQKPDELVESLFKSAKDHGAEVVDPDDASRSAARRKQAEMGARLFAGSGYRLGESESDPSELIPSTSGRAPQSKKVDCVLRLWKTGFTVDDGPLREFAKPENAEFLSAISKGEVPKELIRQAHGSEVSLNMEDHRTEDYVPPKVQMKAFTGHGQMLGSPAPQVVASRGPAATAAAAVATGSQSKLQAGCIQVDETQPTTTLQLRLADGTRLVVKFNLSHTVDDVRRYIRSAKLQYATASFVLLTTFPNRELTDGTATLKDANLLNAVIVQKMI